MDHRFPACGQCGRHPQDCGHQERLYFQDSFVDPTPGWASNCSGQRYHQQAQAFVGTWSGIDPVQQQQTLREHTSRRMTGPPGQHLLAGASPWSNLEGRSMRSDVNRLGERPRQGASGRSNRPPPPTDQYNPFNTQCADHPYPTMLDELEGAEYNSSPNGQQTAPLASREILGIPGDQTFHSEVYHGNRGGRSTRDENSSLRTIQGSNAPESFTSQTRHVDRRGPHEHVLSGPNNTGPRGNGTLNAYAADGRFMPSNARVRFLEEPYEINEDNDGDFESDSD